MAEAPYRPLLLVVADAGTGVGNGHVIRSVALAQAWIRRGGRGVMAAAGLSGDLRAEVERSGLAVRDLDPNAGLALLVDELRPAWTVLDGYRFGSAHQAAARGSVTRSRVCVIDDHASVGVYEADLVVDQNLGADAASYAVRPGGRVLAGAAYILLRQAFVDRGRLEPHVGPAVDRLLVSLGGWPPREASARIAEALEGADLTDRTMVLGSGAPITDMPALLADVDLALSAAGTFVWELCFSAVPMILMPVADNQVPIATRVAARGAGIALASDAAPAEIASALRHLAGDAELRRRLAAAASALVDGRGTARVVTAMKESMLTLRLASVSDTALTLRWANDPVVRASSFTTRTIAGDEHAAWFAARIVDHDARIFIAEDEVGPVGQFRAQRDDRAAVVGVVVAPERRGEGWGPALIAAATRSLFAEGFADLLDAYIRPENGASLNAFELAGYGRVGARVVDGSDPVHYARARDDSL